MAKKAPLCRHNWQVGPYRYALPDSAFSVLLAITTRPTNLYHYVNYILISLCIIYNLYMVQRAGLARRLAWPSLCSHGVVAQCCAGSSASGGLGI